MDENDDSKADTEEGGDVGSRGRSARGGGDEIVAFLFSVSIREMIASLSAVRSEMKLFALLRRVPDKSVKS